VKIISYHGKDKRQLGSKGLLKELLLMIVSHTFVQFTMKPIINCVKQRFDQPGFVIYRNLQDILIKCIKKEKYDDNLEVIASLYQCEIDSEQLKVHLETHF